MNETVRLPPEMPPGISPAHIYDAIIIGGGQTGLAIAWGLLREGITNILIVDENPAGLEGPWATFARMPTLRTPKGPTGADAGLPELTVESWYENTFGREAWELLTLMPTDQWMSYLQWIRAKIGVSFINEVKLLDILPRSDDLIHLNCKLITRHSSFQMIARKVILATGFEGSGGASLPPIADTLPRHRIAHSSDRIDFAALKNARVGVVGAGASAFDNAATAAEAGAKIVHQFVRRPELPKVNLVRWMDFVSFGRAFYRLPDARRRAYLAHFLSTPMPPPPETLRRIENLENHVLHLDAPILLLTLQDNDITLTTPAGTQKFDFMIFGTGFASDLKSRPELQHVIKSVSFWGDRRTDCEKDSPVDREIDKYPYLGPEFQLQELMPGGAPYLRNIHIANIMSVASMGPIGTGGINGLKYMTARLVRGVLRDLSHRDDLETYQEAERLV